MKNNLLIQILQWVCAVVLAMGIVSVLGFFYYRPIGWLERDKNATSAIWEPSTVLVNCIEGIGITRIDSHGYANPWGKELDQELVLCIGASYVQSKEVMENQKYTALLNEKLSSGDKLKVYNLSRDAYMYPEIVAGFSAAVEEFPQTKIAVIDVSSTDYSLEELEGALVQREYSKDQVGDKLYANLSAMEKIKIKIKDYLPITSILKHQLSQIQKGTKEDVINKEQVQEISKAEYMAAVDATMKQMKKNFAGKIIILYHPIVLLNEDGTISLKEQKYQELFAEACEQNGIVFVDMGEDFLQAYEEDYILPYGFHNTTMGEGHINKYGHEMIADKLYETIEKE